MLDELFYRECREGFGYGADEKWSFSGDRVPWAARSSEGHDRVFERHRSYRDGHQRTASALAPNSVPSASSFTIGTRNVPGFDEVFAPRLEVGRTPI